LWPYAERSYSVRLKFDKLVKSILETREKDLLRRMSLIEWQEKVIDYLNGPAHQYYLDNESESDNNYSRSSKVVNRPFKITKKYFNNQHSVEDFTESRKEYLDREPYELTNPPHLPNHRTRE
jgi:hypothetical protein